MAEPERAPAPVRGSHLRDGSALAEMEASYAKNRAGGDSPASPSRSAASAASWRT